MKTLVASLVASSFLVVPASGHAGVNCAQVNKYLSTGRTPEDVADTMVVDVAEVKKCQAEAGAAAGGGEKKPDPKAEAAPKK